MSDSKIDSLDVGALESSVNDSAGRVSGIWLSFVAFSAYLAAAASMISQRQLFLEEPIKLPTINIDLPLFASGILLPLLFVIYHIFVLLQVVLLARTADAYNDAIEHAVSDPVDRTRMRQRLANTLFAQLFAGSPREREGVLGWLLRSMAWITLAIAPVFVLIVFEIKFLPYHSALVTWTHRGLIMLDVLAVLFLWAAAINPSNDIKLRTVRPHWRLALGGAFIVLLSCFVVTFPGEPTRMWMQFLPLSDDSKDELAECRIPKGIGAVIPITFDRIVLPGGDFVDDDKLEKILKVANSNKQRPYQSERTQSFRDRDLRCARFPGADFRHADFAGSDLSGAILRGAHLEGATFPASRLVGAILDNALLQDSSFAAALLLDARTTDDAQTDGAKTEKTKTDATKTRPAQLSNAFLRKTQLQGANLEQVDLEGAYLEETQLRGANLLKVRLSRATLAGIDLKGMDLSDVELKGANLRYAQLQGATLNGAKLHGANLYNAEVQDAKLHRADLPGASLDHAKFQGTTLSFANLSGASLDGASLIAADLDQADLRGASLYYTDLHAASLEAAKLQTASLKNAMLQSARLVSAHLEGALLEDVRLQGANLERSYLTEAVFAKPFVWRARGACADAHVTEPRLDRSWDIVTNRRGSFVQQVSPEAIKSLIDSGMKGVSAGAVNHLRSSLATLLEPEADDDAMRDAIKAWSECAEATLARTKEKGELPGSQYETALAAFLVGLACADGPDQKYIAEGVYRYRVRKPDASVTLPASPGFSLAIARGLLGLDKPCPGAMDIDAKTRTELRLLVAGKPAN